MKSMDIQDNMTYTHELKDNIAIFKLEGNMLGTSENDQLKADVINFLDKGTNKFVLDLTDLKHINSTGLGVFITILTKIKSKGGEMVLSNPTLSISNLLKITKLSSVFHITKSTEESIQYLNK